MIIGITTTLNEVDGFQRVNVEYIAKVADAGAIPVLIPPVEGGFERNAEQARGVMDHLDGVILSGGGDIHPRHYVTSVDESVWARLRSRPKPSSAGGGAVDPKYHGAVADEAALASTGAIIAGPVAGVSDEREGGIRLDGRLTAESDAPAPICLDGLLAVSDNRDGLEITLARLAHERGIPVLGICRGMQIMNVALGGSLHRDLLETGVTERHHRQEPPYDVPQGSVRVEPGSLLGRVFPADADLPVNTMHHQGVKAVADALKVCALSPDGIVEGLEDPDHPFYLGVQWHPEYLDAQNALFEAFIAAVKRTAG